MKNAVKWLLFLGLFVLILGLFIYWLAYWEPAHPEHGHRLVVLLNQVHQERILLVIRERNAAHVDVIGDIGDQCAATQLNIVWMGSKEKQAFPGKYHAQTSCLFLGDDTADDLRHDELALFIKFHPGDFLDLAHHVFEIVFPLEKAGPEFAVLGERSSSIADEWLDSIERERILEDLQICRGKVALDRFQDLARVA